MAESSKSNPPAEPRRSLLLPIAMIVNTLLVAGIAVVVVVFQGKLPFLSEPAPAAAQEAPPVKEVRQFGPLVELQPIIVNLNDPGGDRYLKATVRIEVENDKAAADLNTALVPIRDGLLVFFATLSMGDVVGAEKQAAHRKSIGKIVDDVVGQPLVKNVYFSEFVVR